MSKFKVGNKVLISINNQHMCAGKAGYIKSIDKNSSTLRSYVSVEVDGSRYNYWIADCDLSIATNLNNIENLSQQGAQC